MIILVGTPNEIRAAANAISSPVGSGASTARSPHQPGTYDRVRGRPLPRWARFAVTQLELATFLCVGPHRAVRRRKASISSRIQPVTIDSAPQASKGILEGLKKALGSVPNLYATIAKSPAALQALVQWDQLLASGGLSKREIELINLHVSELNGCAYCVGAHNTLGKMAGISAAEMLDARDGRGQNERESALLALARRVTRAGGPRAGADIARAREAGVSDAEVIEVLAVVASKVFTNAVALVAETEVDFPLAPRMPSN